LAGERRENGLQKIMSGGEESLHLVGYFHSPACSFPLDGMLLKFVDAGGKNEL